MVQSIYFLKRLYALFGDALAAAYPQIHQDQGVYIDGAKVGRGAQHSDSDVVIRSQECNLTRRAAVVGGKGVIVEDETCGSLRKFAGD